MSDFAVRLEEARKRLPLRQLMEQRGRGPGNGVWRKFPKCPYCGKDGSGLFAVPAGKEMFKCYHAHCPSGTADKGAAWDEVGFLQHELRLSGKEAAITLLKEAGLWQEREPYAPSVMPGRAARRTPLPSDQENASGPPGPVGEEGVPAASAPAAPVKDLASPAGVVPEEISVGPVSGSLPGDSPGLEPGTGLEFPPQSSHEAEPGDATPSGGRPPEPPPVGLPVVPPPGEAPSAPAGEGRVVELTTGKLTAEADDTWLPPGTKAIREFDRRLSLSAADERRLWERRALEWATVNGLGFKSNPRSNKDILIELEQSLGYEEMEAAGLWSVGDYSKGKRKKERRPNAQYCGAGIIRKLKRGERPGKGEWADDKDNLWGWCEPILIPYFDEQHELIGLRPHKGGGRSGTLVGTPRPYIPRSLDHPMPEFYSTVIITEGEFKAAAIWQTIGPGRTDGQPPYGVASLPGISFARNESLRQKLDRWLQAVKCYRVITAFDNEEKGDPRLASYKPDREKRFEAQKWAQYLGLDLHRKLHVRGDTCVIPNEWRNAQGKADWDGVLAMVVHGERGVTGNKLTRPSSETSA